MVSSNPSRAVRWWPAVTIVALSVATLCWIWFTGDQIGQQRVMRTFPALGATVLLLLVWLSFFSRVAWRLRWRLIVLCVLILLSIPAVFRVRGVSGDLVPILEWRWSPKADATLDRLTPSHVIQSDGKPTESVALPQAELKPTTTSPSRHAASTTQPVSRGDSPVPVVRSVHDYPQFLGPNRNGTVRGVTLFRDWSARPPRLVWKRRIGAGWSGFAVVGLMAITQEQRKDEEMVVAYSLMDGRPLWTHGDRVRYESVIAGDGPRATPTVSGNRVYTAGSTGLLNCLDLATGKRIWRRDIVADNEGSDPTWGRSGSPLVIDQLVIVSAGGADGKSLVAYHRETGALVWRAGNDRVGFSSPTLMTLAGRPQILIFNASSIASHDTATGRLLWEHPWPAEQPNVAQPVPLPGDRLLVSSGYGIGSKLFEIRRHQDEGFRAELVWESPRLKAKFTNLVVHSGFVYGLDDGVLVCLDPSDGERRWKAGRYGHGQVILVDDLLLVQTEYGEVVLVEPRPDALRELARFTALAGKTWNSPTLAGPYLLIRNDREAACYQLPLVE